MTFMTEDAEFPLAGGPVVDRVGEDEWRVWREVRLAALADTPGAFGSGIQEEEAIPEENWRFQATGRSRLAESELRMPGGRSERPSSRQVRLVLRRSQWCHIEQITSYDPGVAVIIPSAHTFNLK